MAQVVNVTPASQVSQVEINNRQLNVVVQKEVKSVDVTLETRGDIAVEISRAVSQTGVQNIIGGADISVSNVAGNVTIDFAPNGFTSTGNISAPYFLGNVIGNITGNIVVPGLNTDVLYNNNGNVGANDNFQYNPANTTLTVTGNIVATNISGNGSGLSAISGANVTGTVANATYATTAGTVTTASQPNITSVGTLTSVSVTGNVTAGNIKSDHLLYANGSPYQFTTNAAGTNTQVQFNDNNSFGGNSSFTFNKTTGLVTATGFSGNGAQLTSIAGANVTGVVANATHALNADNSLTAGTVTTNAQPNITSVGTLSGLSINGQVTGNLIPTGNIQYSLGNSTNRWNDLYLAGNTIYLGGVELSATNGELSIPGANLSGDLNTTGNANISSDLNVTGNAVITGNLTVDGNTYYTNVETLVVEDPIIEQGGGPNGAPLTSNDGKDRGELLHYYTTEPVDAFMGWDNSGGEFIFGSNVTNTNEVISVTDYGNIHAGNATLGNLVIANYYQGQFDSSSNNQSNITDVGILNSLHVSGNVEIDSSITSVDSITLDTAATEAYAAAKLYWNSVDGTMNIGMYNDVIQQVGQEIYFYGKAAPGATITNGQVVMFAGVQGDHILMAPADAAAVGFRKEWLIGIATQDIATGDFGYVTWFGKINNVSTDSFIAGDLLWFDPSNGLGALTSLEPSAPSIKVLMASVIKEETSPSAGNGIYLVRPTFGPQLNDIQEVQVSNPLVNQTLVYDDLGQYWYNGYINEVEQANVANVANSVAVANVVGIGNIATINLDDSTTNVLYGNGVFAALPSTENANYASYAGNITIGAQPNITSVGTLTTLAVGTGGIGVNGNVSASRITSTVATGTAPFTVSSTTTVANLSVANATYANTAGAATTAGTVTTAAQPNITSTGTLTALTISNGATLTNLTIGNATSNVRLYSNGAIFTGTIGIGSNTISGVTTLFANNVTVSSTGNLKVNKIYNANSNPMFIANGSDGTVDTAADLNVGGYVTAAGANISIKWGNINFLDSSGVQKAQFEARNNDGNITISSPKLTLGPVGNVKITGGSSGQVLSTDGLGNLSWTTGGGGGGTPGGLNTELQFNNAGSFGGISTVTYDGLNLSLGSVANVKMTGGSSNLFVRTDGTGNLSFQAITSNLTVATRTVASNVAISNYQMNVEARTGNVTVNVN